MSGNTSATGGYLVPTNQILDDDALVDVLTALVAGVTQLDPTLIRPRWQIDPPNQPSKTTNWCAFGISSKTRLDYPYIEHFPGYDVMQRQERMDCEASFMGPEAYIYARKLRDGLYLPQNLESVAVHDIKLYEVGDLVEVPVPLVSTQFVRQVDVPVVFMRQINEVFQILDVASMEESKTTDTGLVVSINLQLP